MKRTCLRVLSGLTIAGLLTLSLPSAWANPESSVELNVLSGTVTEKLPGAPEWIPAKTDGIPPGTWLKTSSNSAAVVSFPNQVRFRLAEDTRLHLRSVAPGQLECQLETGRVFVTIPMDREIGLTLEGPHSTVKALSGSFFLDVSGQQAHLRVLEGNAQLLANHVGLAQLASLPSMVALLVPPDVDAVASDKPLALKDTRVDLSASQVQTPPVDPNTGSQTEFDTSAGQDEEKQDAKNIVPWNPTPVVSTVTESGGFNPLFLLAGAGGIGLALGFIGGGGGSSSQANNVAPGPYSAPPPGF